MTDVERLEKLKQAKNLIRDVEFSYPYGHNTRHMLYRVMVTCFSMTDVGLLMTRLSKKINHTTHYEGCPCDEDC